MIGVLVAAGLPAGRRALCPRGPYAAVPPEVDPPKAEKAATTKNDKTGLMPDTLLKTAAPGPLADHWREILKPYLKL